MRMFKAISLKIQRGATSVKADEKDPYIVKRIDDLTTKELPPFIMMLGTAAEVGVIIYHQINFWKLIICCLQICIQCCYRGN